MSIDSLRSPSLPEPPRALARARPAVLAVLARTGASCLQRAAVLQAWDLSHDHRRDIVIGVTSPGAGFRAHAWLDGEEGRQTVAFTELVRLPPPSNRSANR